MCERTIERLRRMSNQAEPRFDLCRYGLHDVCVVYERAREPPTQEDCKLCIKVYRLKHGLKTIVESRGFRTGVTL